MFAMKHRQPRGDRIRRYLVLAILASALIFLLGYRQVLWTTAQSSGFAEIPFAKGASTRIGINLFGLATYNRQRVFTNLISQSEWFSSEGKGWSPMPSYQLDDRGWVKFLKPGQSAPRPLMLSGATFGAAIVHCTFQGTGAFSAGGVARLKGQGAQRLVLQLVSDGARDEGAWIELVRTDEADPVRNIDCRESGREIAEHFDPEFIHFIQPFRIVRFLDWQRTNDNAPVSWDTRALPGDSSQVGPAGASIEDMVDLANRVNAEPWFLMPYKADPTYIRAFAQLVHDRIDPHHVVHVELGNEVWNDMFDAARQAQREGLTLGLGSGDATEAGALRYAQKLRTTMQIWTEVFADRPDRLVRVAASQNANPDLAEIILGYADTARWVDALATAPYVWLDMNGRSVADVDWIYGRMDRAIEESIDFAVRNRAIAARYDKRFVAYEGGQHLVTADMALARAIQRDPRMGKVYQRYLDRWDARVRSDLTLYASTAPISEYGSWGLREYAGQPVEDAPKLQAVMQYLGRCR